MAPDERPRQGHEQREGTVQGGREGGVRPAVRDELGHERGREGKRHDAQQEHEVQPLEASVKPRDDVDKRVVVQPDHADRQVRGEVGDVRRPIPTEHLQELSRRDLVDRRDVQIQDEERDRDRHDAVAERLDPARPPEPLFDLLVHAGTDARSTTGVRSSPSRSTATVTLSPGSRYRPSVASFTSSRQPPPTVPLPKRSPARRWTSADARASIAANEKWTSAQVPCDVSVPFTVAVIASP